MTQRILRRARACTAASLGILAACAGERTTEVVGGGAGVPPTVTVQALNGAGGSLSLTQPVEISVTAGGERAIRRVTIDVVESGQRLGGLDTILVTPVPTATVTARVPLVGVTVGEMVELRATARDVRNLMGGDTLVMSAVAAAVVGARQR